MDEIIKALERTGELLKDRRFFWQPSQDKRDAKARAILNELLLHRDLSSEMKNNVNFILSVDFAAKRSAAKSATTAAIFFRQTELNHQGAQ